MSTLAATACEHASRDNRDRVDDASTPCARALRAWMTSLVDEGYRDMDMSGSDRLIYVPPATSTFPLPLVPIITITAETVSFLGEHMAESATLVEDRSGTWMVPELYERLELEWRKFPHTTYDVIIMAEVSAPWTAIRRAVLTAKAAGAENIAFAVRKRTQVTAPGPSSVDEGIAKIEAKLRADFLAGRISFDDPPIENHPLDVAHGGCPAALERLTPIWRDGYGDRDAFLVDELPGLIERCGCNVDIEAIKALHWWWSGRLDGLVTVGIRVRLAGAGAAVSVSVPDGATTWGDAHERVLGTIAGAEGPVSFEVGR